MRIAVVGLGGVGGYLASMLSKTSHEVVGFARGEHLQAVQEGGVKIVEENQTWSARIDARELHDADGYFDIVLFCVKSYDLENSYKQISSFVDKKSVILSFSNGVSNAKTLQMLSDSTVLDACIYILSHIENSGVIRKKGEVFAAVFGGEEMATQKLKELFDEASLRNKTPHDIQSALWKKYIFISAFATLTSYYDKSIGYVYENHYTEAKALLEEIALVAKTNGIDIEEEIEKSLVTARKVPYDSSTSMHLDFTKHKKTELEALSGYIVKEAQKIGVNVPQMEKMYNKLLYKI